MNDISNTKIKYEEQQLKLRFKVNSKDKAFAETNVFLDFPRIKFIMSNPVYFKTRDTILEKSMENDGSWSYTVTQTFDFTHEQQMYNYEFFTANKESILIDEVFSLYFTRDTLPFMAVPMKILKFEIFTIKCDDENSVDLTDRITQNCQDLLMLKEQERIKEVLRRMLQSEECMEYCEAFMVTLDKLIATDDDKRDRAGYYLLNAILGESYDDLLASLCGWKLKSVLIKALLLPDNESEFHDKICGAEYLTEWENEVEISQPCKVNTKTFEVFDIQYNYEQSEEEKSIIGEYVVIDDIKHPVFPKDESTEKAYPVFWYGDNE